MIFKSWSTYLRIMKVFEFLKFNAFKFRFKKGFLKFSCLLHYGEPLHTLLVMASSRKGNKQNVSVTQFLSSMSNVNDLFVTIECWLFCLCNICLYLFLSPFRTACVCVFTMSYLLCSTICLALHRFPKQYFHEQHN